jgi:hypothetical protein
MLKKSLFLSVSLATISGIAVADSTVHVTNNGNDGEGSFRYAVGLANNYSEIDKILFEDVYSIGLQSEVVYTGTQDLHIEGNGSTLSGGSVNVDTDKWDSGLFVAKGCASLTIEDLTFEKSFNNGLAVFLGHEDEDSGYQPCPDDVEVSIGLGNVFVSQSQFFGVLVDGQKTTDFNTDDYIHHNCSDPWPHDVNVPISVTVTDSEVVQNGRLDGDFDISLETGCPQDFDGLRVDQGGAGDLDATLISSYFDHNLADGVELDEKGDGSVSAEVEGSTFNHNGDTREILCTQEAHDAQEDDDQQCENGKYVQDLDDGFDIDEEGEGNMTAVVTDTEVNGNHDEGLDFDEADGGDINVVVDNVTAIQNEDEALKVSEEDDGSVEASIFDSSFKHGGDDGTQIEEEGDGNILVEMTNSTITHNAKYGVKVEESDDGSGELEITNTDLSHNGKGAYDTDGDVTVIEN